MFFVVANSEENADSREEWSHAHGLPFAAKLMKLREKTYFPINKDWVLDGDDDDYYFAPREE